MQGTINSISIAGMLRLLCSYGKTGSLMVNSGKIKGSIDIIDGEVTGVVAEKCLNPTQNKKDALVQLLLAIEEGSFYFEEKPPAPNKPLGISIEEVILESAREIYEKYYGQISVKDMIFPENEVLKMARLGKGKVLTMTMHSEEWNLMASFNGDSNITTALENTGIAKEKAEIIMYGLVSAGFVRRMRFKIPEVSKIAKESFGNIGVAIVDNEMAKQKIDSTKMGMKNFIGLLNGLENSFAEIVGRARAKEVIEKIWNATK